MLDSNPVIPPCFLSLRDWISERSEKLCGNGPDMCPHPPNPRPSAVTFCRLQIFREWLVFAPQHSRLAQVAEEAPWPLAMLLLVQD